MSEADTLRLTAEVADRFSGPLRSLRDHLAQVKAPQGLRTMQTEFNETARSVSTLRQDIQRGLRPELDSIGLKALGLAGAFAAVTSALRSFSGSTNDLRRVSQEVGISIERLRAFGAVAERAGIDPAAMSAATKQFAINMRNVRVGVGDTLVFLRQQDQGINRFAESLAKIGDNDSAFVFALQFLRQIPNAVDRMKVAQSLFGNMDFGRLGLVDVLKSLREVAEEQGKLPKGAEQAAEANELAFLKLNNRLKGLRDDIGATVLPAMTELTEVASKFLADNKEGINTGISSFLRDTKWSVVRDDIRGIGTAFADVAKIINSVVQSLGGWEAATKVLLGLWAANKFNNLLGGLPGKATKGVAGLTSLGSAAATLGPLGLAFGMVNDKDNSLRSWLRKLFGIEDPNEPSVFDKGGVFNKGSKPSKSNERFWQFPASPTSFGGGGGDAQDAFEASIYRGMLRALTDFSTQRLGGEGIAGGGSGGIVRAGFRSSGWSPVGDGGGGDEGHSNSPLAQARRAARGVAAARSGVGSSAARALGGAGVGDVAGASGLKALIEREAKAAGVDSRIMFGIHAGESLHLSRYDKKDDAQESSWGPFQLNRRRGTGVEFERDTGLDLRDPSTIPAQVRYVAQYLRRHYDKHPGYSPFPNWQGFKGKRDWDPSWGSAGYRAGSGTEGGSADLKAGWGGRTNSFASPSSNYPEMGAGRGGEAAPVGSFLRGGDAPWSNGGGADLSRKARESGALGGPVKAEGSVSVTLEGFPKGVKAKTSSDGLFQLVKLNRGRAMAEADG